MLGMKKNIIHLLREQEHCESFHADESGNINKMDNFLGHLNSFKPVSVQLIRASRSADALSPG